MQKTASIFKKLHHWPGLIMSVVLLFFSFSGILMNHRNLISGVDISRKLLPNNYAYKNWNNAALKGSLIINNDSILLFGNIGVWRTDSLFANFQTFNIGFPKGSDNRKIFDLHRSANGNLYAASLFGLYSYNRENKKWQKIVPEFGNIRFVAIESIGDTLYALSRSHLFVGLEQGVSTTLQKREIAMPIGYENRVTMFQTFWQIHSGEIFGLPGQLFVDLLGIITAFLSITGIIYFFFPGWIKRRKASLQNSSKLITVNRWSIKWHNSVGNWTFVFLIILFFTGMFLRPPLLIPIANLVVSPIKYTHLHQPNPWYDKLRDIRYDAVEKRFLLATSSGIYNLDINNTSCKRFDNQPPVSVMGINVFEPHKQGDYLVGSFSGLFLWHPNRPEVYNFATNSLHKTIEQGSPIGDNKISGMITKPNGNAFMVEYDKGFLPLFSSDTFAKMPANIVEQSKMSLWNVSLEIHTGRIFQGFMGMFYILLVPLSGIIGIMVLISGYLLLRSRKNRNS